MVGESTSDFSRWGKRIEFLAHGRTPHLCCKYKNLPPPPLYIEKILHCITNGLKRHLSLLKMHISFKYKRYERLNKTN